MGKGNKSITLSGIILIFLNMVSIMAEDTFYPIVLTIGLILFGVGFTSSIIAVFFMDDRDHGDYIETTEDFGNEKEPQGSYFQE